MASQHRLARWTPVNVLNPFERVDCVDYVAKGLRALGFALHCEFKYSAITTSEQRDSINPEEVLAALTVLQSQVMAAYNTCGLSAAAAAGVYELTNRHVPQGAGPQPHDPNFSNVLKAVYENVPKTNEEPK